MTSGLKRLIVVAAAALSLIPAPASGQTIAVQGDHFTVDRHEGAGPQAKFLLFISYFDALRATDPLGDLDYIANTLRFDGVRILPNWDRRTSGYCEDGDTDLLFEIDGDIRGDTSPATGPLKQLLDFVEAARVRKLIVDVTFTRATVSPDMTADNYLRAVTRIATLLRPYRNVLFDLDNEVQNNGTAEADTRRIRDAILANPDSSLGDPARIVTVSRSGPVTDVVGYNQRTAMSAIAYHDERFPGTWQNNVPGVVSALRASGKPVYLQEPMPWNSGLTICGQQEPTQKEADGEPARFRTAVANARASGAAAWTFHTRQSFKLDTTATLRSRIQANATEKELLEGAAAQSSLSTIAGAGPWPIDTILTVDVAGTGDGAVTSSPAGIQCGLTATACSAAFAPGTVVTLTPSPAAGSELTSWEGCTGSPACSVTLDMSRTVSVRFTAVEQIFYYDTDAIGSTRLVTGSGGAFIEGHDYTPFGVEVTASTGFTPRLFAGKQHDSETAFDYFGARHYAASIARFVSPDPRTSAETAIFDPQRWHRYAYVGNRPTRVIDPDGRGWASTIFKLGKAVVKGGNFAVEFAGVIDDVQTVFDGDADVGARVWAAVSLASEIWSPVSVGDAKGIASVVRRRVPFDDLMREAERRASSIGAVIGHYKDGYNVIGNRLRVATFDLPTEIYERLDPATQKAANKAFLDGLIKRGATIFVATSEGVVRGSNLAWEIEYLKKAGYVTRGRLLVPGPAK